MHLLKPPAKNFGRGWRSIHGFDDQKGRTNGFYSLENLLFRSDLNLENTLPVGKSHGMEYEQKTDAHQDKSGQSHRGKKGERMALHDEMSRKERIRSSRL